MLIRYEIPRFIFSDIKTHKKTLFLGTFCPCTIFVFFIALFIILLSDICNTYRENYGMTDAIYRLKRFILLEMLSDIVQQPRKWFSRKRFCRSLYTNTRWLNYERMHLIKARFILSGMQFFWKELITKLN